MTPTLSSRTYQLGPQTWQVNSDGKWFVLMWGWWPGNTGRPSWRWEHVQEHRVPLELREKAKAH